MSKVYIIFLFLLSGVVQLSHTKLVHGNVFLFRNGKFEKFHELDDNSKVFVEMDRTYKDCLTKHIFYLEVKAGLCSLTYLDIMFDKKKDIQNAQVKGTGICPKNQKIIRWHKKIKGPKEIGENEPITYPTRLDFIFVRDTSVKITEKSLEHIPIQPIIHYTMSLIPILSQFVRYETF